MLSRAKRHPALTDRSALIELFTAQHVPLAPAVLDFQEHFGGIDYRTRSGHGFYFDLFNGQDPYAHDSLQADQDGTGAWFFPLGEHPYAQLGFEIRDDGTVCCRQWHTAELASSVEVYIESDSVEDHMLSLQPEWWWIPLGEMDHEDRRLNSIAAAHRTIVPEASDQFNLWWANYESRIHRQTSISKDPNKDVGFAYFRTDSAATAFKHRAAAALNRALTIERYPY